MSQNNEQQSEERQLVDGATVEVASKCFSFHLFFQFSAVQGKLFEPEEDLIVLN